MIALSWKLARWVGHRFLPGVELSTVLQIVVRWSRTRARGLLRRRGIVRGTAIVWPEFGRAWAIGQDIARPARGQVLVRVVASAVSPGTERAFFARLPNAVVNFPQFPGYSAAGEVVEVGRGVKRFRPKDRVALTAPHASVAVAMESEIFAVPTTVSLEEAAFIQLGIIALHGVQKAQLRPGEPVVVLGHGLIGQLLVGLASAYGAHPVISVSRTAKRVTDLILHAAQRVIILERDGSRALEGLDAAITFEATGYPECIPIALRCTRSGGRVVLVGSSRGLTRNTDFGLLADRAITIVGAHIGSLSRSSRPMQAQAFLHLLERKRIDVASLISERVHPWEAEWFYRRLSGNGDVTVGALFCWERLDPRERMRRVSYFTLPDLTPVRRTGMSVKPLSERVAFGKQEAIRR